jgi:hypothetical protein
MLPNTFRRVTTIVLLAAVVGVGVAGCILVPFPFFWGGHHGRGHEHGRR